MRFANLLVAILVSFGLVMGGCSKKEEKKDEKKTEKTVEKKKADEAKTDEAKTDEAKAEVAKAEEVAKDEPKTDEAATEEAKTDEAVNEAPKATGDMGPKETMEFAINAIKNKKFAAIATMLPASYVADIDAVVQAFANSMDPELFAASVTFSNRVVKIAEAQKATLAELATQMGVPLPKEDVAKIVDGLVQTWAMFDAAGLTKLDTLKTFNTEKFIAENLTKMIDHMVKVANDTSSKALFDQGLMVLAMASVTLEEEAGDTAVVVIDLAGDKEKVDLVKVEGKWVPKDLAKEWKKGIEEAKAGIVEMKTELDKGKTEMLAQITQASVILDQIEKTGDLRAVLGGMGLIPGGAAPAMGMKMEEEAPVAEDDAPVAEDDAPVAEEEAAPAAE